MKIKKLLPEEIADKTLGFKIYRKSLKPSLKKMIGEHNSAETATRFIVKTNFEFSDMKGKKMGLILPGDHTSGWVKMAKEQIKDDKKNTCIGDCYVKKNADGTYSLVLLPEKGAAKKNLMIKQLEKFALKGTPFSIEVGTGGELEEDNAADVVVDDVVLPADEAETEEDDDDDDAAADADESGAVETEETMTEEQKDFKKTMAERLTIIDEQMLKIKEQLKM
jgi:hypothetical protein